MLLSCLFALSPNVAMWFKLIGCEIKNTLGSFEFCTFKLKVAQQKIFLKMHLAHLNFASFLTVIIDQQKVQLLIKDNSLNIII